MTADPMAKPFVTALVVLPTASRPTMTFRASPWNSPDISAMPGVVGDRSESGGVGGSNWRIGREVLKTAGLTVDDAQFIASATAGRLPGLIAGQIDAVALHPEDVFLAKKQKPTLNLLVQLTELMPNYMFNAYGASLDWIGRDRALLRDTAAAMIEANRDDLPRQGQGRCRSSRRRPTSRRKRSSMPSTC